MDSVKTSGSKARNYEFKLVEDSAGKLYKQRISRNIFGEPTRTDNFPFETIKANVNGKDMELTICRWAGNNGDVKSGVKFDIKPVDDAQRLDIINWAAGIGHKVEDSTQLEGFLVIYPEPKSATSPI